MNVIKKKMITNVFYNVLHNQLQCAASTQKGLCLEMVGAADLVLHVAGIYPAQFYKGRRRKEGEC